MDYLFHKLLTQMAMPLGSGGMLILVGILASVLRRRGLGAGLSLCGLLWVWLWATPVFSDWVRLSLERQYGPIAIDALPSADAILVLGGGVEGAAAPRLFPDLRTSADRIWHAARLFHKGKAPIVILVGGRLPWHTNRGREADAMLRFLIDLGVPGGKVLLERHSRNTYENARETQRLLADRGMDQVLLVTSAYHMRRAQAMFRAAGIQTIPAATDYEVLEGRELTLLDFLPDARALKIGSFALREYLGFWFYQWRGWAD
ncbi:YdcF family protein [Candidatus Thiosymbion oneisti]|uniref:YdcF family protein n=2 Tax=Candidatus Thiosymbion oneisti TaxID=589554 RepID=UPI00105D9783|nr:YdcF family protein [Candidatus Thiosymbion oneisti]